MEFLLQVSLPYILQTVVYAQTTTNLLQSPYTFYKTHILLLYYMILFIPESSTIFSVLHNHVTCDL